MPDRKQLVFLENLAAERSEGHAVQLARARQSLKAAEQQLAMLQRYHGTYQTQLGAKLEASLSIESLRGHQSFMGNVANAVRQQEFEVARRRANADAIERAWQDSERRRQGFRVMGIKLAGAEQRADDRMQQKQSDEFASRATQKSQSGF